MTPDKFKDLLDRYARGQCSENERNFVDQWFNNVSNDSSIPDNTEEKLWQKIKPPVVSSAPHSRFYLKIAASIAVLAVVAAALYFFSQSSKHPSLFAEQNAVPIINLSPEGLSREISNESNEMKKVTLEDGSEITLQPHGRISIPEHFANSERIVTLQGEAFFNIKRDTLRPFYVYSGEVVTKVLGTSFNIKACDRDKKIIVAVKTGKVSVFTNPKIAQGAPEVILTPNQKAVYDGNNVAVRKELVEKPEIILAQPTIFKMKYDETPVSEIFRVLEENYGVEIEFDEEQLSNCTLTTSMTKEGLFERIEVICKAIGATYKMDNAVIKIEGKGC